MQRRCRLQLCVSGFGNTAHSTLRYCTSCTGGIKWINSRGAVAPVNFACRRLVTLAAVTHDSLMFSHHGPAEQDARGKWEQLAGREMKRDTVFLLPYWRIRFIGWLTPGSRRAFDHMKVPGVNTLNGHPRGLWAELTRNVQKVVYFGGDNVCETSLEAWIRAYVVTVSQMTGKAWLRTSTWQ